MPGSLPLPRFCLSLFLCLCLFSVSLSLCRAVALSLSLSLISYLCLFLLPPSLCGAVCGWDLEYTPRPLKNDVVAVAKPTKSCAIRTGVCSPARVSLSLFWRRMPHVCTACTGLSTSHLAQVSLATSSRAAATRTIILCLCRFLATRTIILRLCRFLATPTCPGKPPSPPMARALRRTWCTAAPARAASAVHRGRHSVVPRRLVTALHAVVTMRDQDGYAAPI